MSLLSITNSLIAYKVLMILPFLIIFAYKILYLYDLNGFFISLLIYYINNYITYYTYVISN